MLTVPVGMIPTCLRNTPKDANDTAAVELLIAHGTWLCRPDFTDECLEQGTHPDGDPYLFVNWELVPAFLEDASCSSSDARMLAIAAELAGVTTGRTLADLICLDQRHTGLMAAAIVMRNINLPSGTEAGSVVLRNAYLTAATRTLGAGGES